jgi:hypothetical protein
MTWGSWGSLFSSAVGAASNAYTGYVTARANNAIAASNKRVRTVLAGITLTTTMNSAAKRRTELTAEAKRVEFEVQQQARSAEGRAVAEAAATGASGKRVQLAIQQQTAGEADRKLGQLKADLGRQQDALQDQQIASYSQTVSGLLAQPIDVPENYNALGDVLGFAADAYSIYNDNKQFNTAREQAEVNKG